MFARRHQVALAVTAVLTAAAACRAGHHEQRPAAAAPPAPAAGTRPAATAFTLLASGALRPDASVIERAAFDAGGAGHDFRPLLAGVAPAVSGADVALCHLDAVQEPEEAPAAAASGMFPPELAPALAATGYDGCATASAHTLDDGPDGVRRTLDALDRAGIRHAGSARTEDEARGALLRAGSALVAHLAYSQGPDGPPPTGQPWSLRLLDTDRILADARAARQAGADVVVVSLDWGDPDQDGPDAEQTELARRLTAARTGDRPAVDLILGTGSRTPQPYEKVGGTWVVYGTGDQVAGARPGAAAPPGPRTGRSTLARFTFTPPARTGGRWEVTRAEFVPELFDPDAGRVVDVDEAIGRGADLQAVRDGIRDAVLARGAAKDGLVMGR